MKKLLKALLIVGAAGIVAVGLIVFYVQFRHFDRIRTDIAAVGHAPVAIVPGASILTGGEPSDALRDRLETALDLFRRGKIDRILVTGDDGRFHVDEITAMRDFLTKAGVPRERIVVDGQGYRTYESCKRAVQVQDIREAVVVTQRFHLGRALYLCSAFGMDATGIVADRHEYVRGSYFWLRDLASSVKAWWDVNVIPPKPPV